MLSLLVLIQIKMEQNINYQRVAEAIEYISQHFKEQPNLDEVAAKIHLSPFHFQRLFTEWAGVSPKKFLQFLTIEYAKTILQKKENSLLDTAYQTGLSGTGRLHDLFVNIEGMTPGEYKNGGENLTIQYHFSESTFGQILIASTHKGICHIAFVTDAAQAILDLKLHFPKAHFEEKKHILQEAALRFFKGDLDAKSPLNLHLKGTDFQLKVWSALLKIPSGDLATYGNIAHLIQHPKAARAVGTAIGSNPVAYIIPCHRVIQASGIFGGYMWGSTRKTAIIGWEASARSATKHLKNDKTH